MQSAQQSWLRMTGKNPPSAGKGRCHSPVALVGVSLIIIALGTLLVAHFGSRNGVADDGASSSSSTSSNSRNRDLHSRQQESISARQAQHDPQSQPFSLNEPGTSNSPSAQDTLQWLVEQTRRLSAENRQLSAQISSLKQRDTQSLSTETLLSVPVTSNQPAPSTPPGPESIPHARARRVLNGSFIVSSRING